jgi:hypothetical protein
MGICAIAILALAKQETLVTIPPKLRTYAEVALLLSEPEQPVKCDPLVAKRICFASLKGHSMQDTRALVAKGLAVRFAKSGESLLLLEDPARANRSRKLYDAFTGVFDEFHGKVFRNVASIWPFDRLPDNTELDLLLKNNASAEPEMKAAVRLIATTTTNTFGTSTSAPTFFYFNNHGSIRKLIPGDYFNEGNARQWESWTDMPLWVRKRAIAPVEAALTGSNKASNPLAAESLITDSRIFHRIRFEPLDGSISYEFGVIGRAESQMGWYLAQPVSLLVPPKERFSLQAVFEKAGLIDDFQAMSKRTSELILLVSRLRMGRLSEALQSLDREVIAQISPVRDAHQEWISKGGSFSLEESDGVLLVQNESGFLDERYAADVSLHVAMAAKAKPSLSELIKWARSVPEKQNAAVARCDLGSRIRELTRVHPFLSMLSALPRDLQAIEKRLAAGENVQISLADSPSGCSSRFTSSIRPLCYMTAPPARRAALDSVLPISPRYESIVQTSVLSIEPCQLDSGGSSLKFTLATGSGELASAVLSTPAPATSG